MLSHCWTAGTQDSRASRGEFWTPDIGAVVQVNSPFNWAHGRRGVVVQRLDMGGDTRDEDSTLVKVRMLDGELKPAIWFFVSRLDLFTYEAGGLAWQAA